MKKKLFAAAVAACLAVASTMSVWAAVFEPADSISGDLTVGGFYSSLSKGLEVKNNESYTIKFHNKSNGTNNYDNYLLAVAGANGDEIANIRADAWGWGGPLSDFTAPDIDGNKMAFESSVDWANWVANCQAGVDVEIVFSKVDNTISYEAKIGNDSVKFVGTSGIDLPETVYVYLTGENVEITNITTEKNENIEVPPTPVGIQLAENNQITGDLSVTDFFGNKTDAINIKDGESYTFEFNNKSNGVNSWDNYVLAVTTAIGADYTGSLQEVIIVRADNFGWGGEATDIVSSNEEGNQMLFENNIGDNWSDFVSLLQNGTPVKVVLSRDGNTFTYSETVGDYNLKTTTTSGLDLPEDLYVFFTGENCELTGFTTTKNETTYLKGDTDHDGMVGYVDVALLTAAISGDITVSEENFSEYDYDSNGQMDYVDLAMMIDFIANTSANTPAN